MKTRAEPLGLHVIVGDPFTDLKADDVFGARSSIQAFAAPAMTSTAPIAALHAAGAIATVAADPLALTC